MVHNGDVTHILSGAVGGIFRCLSHVSCRWKLLRHLPITQSVYYICLLREPCGGQMFPQLSRYVLQRRADGIHHKPP